MYIYSVMKKLWFYILDKLWDFIYKHRNLYERKPVYAKDLKNKSLEELLLLKDSERDFLSLNVPIVLWIFWVIFIFDDFLWKISFFILFLIALVNLTVAVEEKKENIKIYDKLISKKMQEQKRKEEKHKKEILKYLNNIEKELNDNKK